VRLLLGTLVITSALAAGTAKAALLASSTPAASTVRLLFIGLTSGMLLNHASQRLNEPFVPPRLKYLRNKSTQ
jgi:hypothetical protein